MLKGYDPGVGIRTDGLPILLGFERGTQNIVDLEDTVYNAFPELQFHYDGTRPIAILRVENPEVFYETRSTSFQV